MLEFFIFLHTISIHIRYIARRLKVKFFCIFFYGGDWLGAKTVRLTDLTTNRTIPLSTMITLYF